MSLTLLYRATTSAPVEIEGVVPDRLRGLAAEEINRITVYHGNGQVPLAELFAISGDASDGRIDLEGDLSGVHRIGYGMRAGELHVHGHAGRHLGGQMTGGRITVDGNASDWIGGEMRGGVIQVKGNAGDRIGAAYPGSKKGMTDGTILIGGHAGHEIGASMRRGTLVVGGSSGDDTGFGMIAGTILVFGACGKRIGAGMKRGTIGLLGDEPVKLLPTFRSAGRFRPLFLRLLLAELARLGFPLDPTLSSAELQLWHGDLIALGKGEVWMRAG